MACPSWVTYQDGQAIAIDRKCNKFSRVQYSYQRALTAETLANGGHRTIVEFAAVIDDQHARAEGFYIIHVVGGQQHGHAALGVDCQQELTDTGLCYHVQANRWLVHVEHFRIVEKSRGEVPTHALAKRKLAYRCINEFVQFEQGTQLGQVGAVACFRHAVEVAQQAQRVDQRQVPPELGALAEDDSNARNQLPALLHRIESCNTPGPAAGHQDAREHFNGCAFTGAVGSNEADHLTAFYAQRKVLYGRNDAYLWIEDAAQASD